MLPKPSSAFNPKWGIAALYPQDGDELPTVEQLIAEPWGESQLTQLEGWEGQVVNLGDDPLFNRHSDILIEAELARQSVRVVTLRGRYNDEVTVAWNGKTHQELLANGYIEI